MVVSELSSKAFFLWRSVGPERVTQPEALPGELLVKEAFRGCTEFTVLLWTDWGAMRSPSPGASGPEQVEVVMS